MMNIFINQLGLFKNAFGNISYVYRVFSGTATQTLKTVGHVETCSGCDLSTAYVVDRLANDRERTEGNHWREEDRYKKKGTSKGFFFFSLNPTGCREEASTLFHA
jgi:hypothetical protein